MKDAFIEYQDGAYILEGYVAHQSEEKKPAVIIFHAFRGRDEFVCNMARKLAGLGYVAFAADVYGKGVHAQTKEEAMNLMMPYLENRDILKERVMAAYRATSSLPFVNHRKIAAIGYCFGGLCALDLARSCEDLSAAVSFHGLLTPPSYSGVNKEKINAKILVCHGALDPQVPHSQVEGFQKEMSERSVDWQMHIYGNAMHAFTNPAANDVDFGTVYNADADQRSFLAMQNLFEQVL